MSRIKENRDENDHKTRKCCGKCCGKIVIDESHRVENRGDIASERKKMSRSVEEQYNGCRHKKNWNQKSNNMKKANTRASTRTRKSK